MTSLLLAPTPTLVRPSGPAAPTTPPATWPAAPRRTARRPLPVDALLPVVVALGVAGVYAALALRRFAQMQSGMDLAIFDQALRSLAHLHAPTSAMKSAGMNLWGDHFHPVLVFVAPAYWIWDDPRMLLVVQALSVGTGVGILVRATLDLVTGTARRALAVASGLALAASPGVQSALLFDAHEVAFGVPLLAMALWRLLQRRWGAFAAWSLPLLLVKEDMGLLVAGLGVVAFLWGARRLGVVLGAVALGWTELVIQLVIPALSPSGTWLYAGSVGSVTTSLQHASDAVTSGHLPTMLLALLLGTGLLALGSPLVLALVPSLLARAASGNPVYVGLAFHYNLLAGVVLAFAALDVLRRPAFGARARRVAIAVLALVAAVGAGVVSQRQPLVGAPDAARLTAARRAMDVVPDGAPVAADVFLTPQLTRRHPVTQQVRPSVQDGRTAYLDDLGRPLAAQWVVLDRNTVANGGPAWVGPAVARFRSVGWVVVHDDGGFVVLRR